MSSSGLNLTRGMWMVKVRKTVTVEQMAVGPTEADARRRAVEIQQEIFGCDTAEAISCRPLSLKESADWIATEQRICERLGKGAA